jgi:predicted MFS family arabinose efflux permease
MKPGGWPSIALIYLYGVLASASLSKIIPLLADIGAHLGATALQFGLLISLMTVLPAMFAAVAGSLIDRIGARGALLVAAAIGVLVNLAYLMASSLHAFMVIRVLEGLVVLGIYSAAPALIMATSSPARRGHAMTLWSTYTPVGMSLGLLLSAHFAGTAAWRTGYAIHLILFGALLVVGWWLPRSPAVAREMQARPGLLAPLLHAGPVRLSLTFSALLLMGFGMSTVFPEWFALLHQVSVGAASSILALGNLAMIPGGLVTGWWLASRGREDKVLATIMLLAVVMSVPLFMPGTSQALRTGAMVIWLMIQGGAIAVVTASLPRVVVDPAQGAAAAGLLSQIAAITTFITPLVWRPILAGGIWLLFLIVVAGSAAAAVALFPRRQIHS